MHNTTLLCMMIDKAVVSMVNHAALRPVMVPKDPIPLCLILLTYLFYGLSRPNPAAVLLTTHMPGAACVVWFSGRVCAAQKMWGMGTANLVIKHG